jgi:broad specificity phosphatase PhoE
LEIFSISRSLANYLEDHTGGPIRWPVVGRVSKVLLDIISRHPNERVAVVAHSGVISAALTWYFPKNRWRWWRTTVSNCSLTRFLVEGNRAKLLALNDIQHLSPAIITTQPPAKTVEIAKAAAKVEGELELDKDK